MSFCGITADRHVHCGQYYDTYYQPAYVVKCLHENGIKEGWISSTTSCIAWSTAEEKKYLLRHIEDEMAEALLSAKEYNVALRPLYWVIPKRHLEGESVEKIMTGSSYGGFKIHTRAGEWDNDIAFTDALLDEVCSYAARHRLPILIHTGIDEADSPNRFERYFSSYKDVTFVLAHCRAAERVIEMFSRYDNVYGDTAFCDKESYISVCAAGFKSRIQTGTDFPITHWVGQKESGSVSYSKLSQSYKNTLKQLSEMTADL